SYVLATAIGEGSLHFQQVDLAQPGRQPRRRDRQLGHARLFNWVKGSPPCNPFRQCSIFLRVDGGTRAALMGNAAERPEQQQTLLGLERVQTAAARVAQDRCMVALRVSAKEQQTNAVLPLNSPMTDAGIAAKLAEQGNDVPAEACRFRLHGVQ